MSETSKGQDIVERLRDLAEIDPDYYHATLIQEAAAEIARLRAALLAIREQGYVCGLEADDWPVCDCEWALGGLVDV
jgi:hypothetical protein